VRPSAVRGAGDARRGKSSARHEAQGAGGVREARDAGQAGPSYPFGRTLDREHYQFSKYTINRKNTRLKLYGKTYHPALQHLDTI
jgi:hypothetical protein